MQCFNEGINDRVDASIPYSKYVYVLKLGKQMNQKGNKDNCRTFLINHLKTKHVGDRRVVQSEQQQSDKQFCVNMFLLVIKSPLCL